MGANSPKARVGPCRGLLLVSHSRLEEADEFLRLLAIPGEDGVPLLVLSVVEGGVHEGEGAYLGAVLVIPLQGAELLFYIGLILLEAVEEGLVLVFVEEELHSYFIAIGEDPDIQLSDYKDYSV